MECRTASVVLVGFGSVGTHVAKLILRQKQGNAQGVRCKVKIVGELLKDYWTCATLSHQGFYTNRSF